MDMPDTASNRTIHGSNPSFRNLLILRAQKASLEALGAFIHSEAFYSSTASGQLKIIVSALVKSLAQSTISLSTLQTK
jgi:hypothetical protein